jgi:hypothetical protein
MSRYRAVICILDRVVDNRYVRTSVEKLGVSRNPSQGGLVGSRFVIPPSCPLKAKRVAQGGRRDLDHKLFLVTQLICNINLYKRDHFRPRHGPSEKGYCSSGPCLQILNTSHAAQVP